MSDERPGPSAGDILVGTFVILSGLCIALVGGACSVMWAGFMAEPGGLWTSLALLAVSLACTALGLLCMWQGLRMARGRYRG
jgi:hypothetical protein